MRHGARQLAWAAVGVSFAQARGPLVGQGACTAIGFVGPQATRLSSLVWSPSSPYVQSPRQEEQLSLMHRSRGGHRRGGLSIPGSVGGGRQSQQPLGAGGKGASPDEGTEKKSSTWAEELSWPTLVSKMSTQTTSRVLALKVWLVFIWYTFLSSYAPGPVPNPLDPAIIAQVGGLTLNYWCILPTLLPNLAPAFSPVMEGVFNLLLAWSTLFSGFLVDGRKKGWSINLFAPFMAAMVVLTNTAYLPYLIARPLHSPDSAPSLSDLSKVERQLGESKGLLGLYGLAGVYSIWWGFFGRPEFGGLAERYASFQDLLSSDRLMFAFTVELVLFALFQGVMVDDDLARRGLDPAKSRIGFLAKYVPFFGLIAYFFLRPPLPGEPRDD